MRMKTRNRELSQRVATDKERIECVKLKNNLAGACDDSMTVIGNNTYHVNITFIRNNVLDHCLLFSQPGEHHYQAFIML
jgi:hypothetical protein